MITRPQLQYPQKFEPIDSGGQPPAMTPEVWRETPRVYRRRLSVALLAPFVFFVDVPAAPADTGEWQFRQPTQRRSTRKIISREATFAPPEVFDFPGLEDLGREPQTTARRRPARGESVFAPPDATTVDSLEWMFEQAPAPKRRRVVQGSISQPIDVAAAPTDTGEWAFHEPPIPRRRTRVQGGVTQPPEVAAAAPVDAGEWVFRQAQPPRRRPRIEGAIVSPPEVAAAPADTLEWLFRPPDQPRRKRIVRGEIFQPIQVAVVPDTLEWRFQPPAVRRKVYRHLRPEVFSTPELDPGYEWIQPYRIAWRARRIMVASVPAVFFPLEPWELLTFDPLVTDEWPAEGLLEWEATRGVKDYEAEELSEWS